MTRFAPLLLLLGCCGNAFTQSAVPATPAPSAPPAATAAVATASPPPFLWKITVGPVTHSLLGSVPLLPASVQPLPATLDQASGRAQHLAFHTHLRDPASAASTL